MQPYLSNFAFCFPRKHERRNLMKQAQTNRGATLKNLRAQQQQEEPKNKHVFALKTNLPKKTSAHQSFYSVSMLTIVQFMNIVIIHVCG